MPPVPDSTPKVFVSYSRRDIAFVDELEAALRARGIEPLIDRQEIFAFEDWWRRIEALIASADTIVFVLSPDAVASDVCRREVEHAGSLNKRFAPVVARAVDPGLVPEDLSRLNFIHLDEGSDFAAGVDRLVEALGTDIHWVRRHTEFGTLAQRWDAAGRPGPHGLLLRPPMLEEAERWIASRPANAPLPTEETQAIIAESRRTETRRRARVTVVLGLGLAMALLLSLVAFWQRQVARENERAAVAAREAETVARQGEAEQRRLAQAREREAVEAGERVLVGQSRFLADASARSLGEKDAGTALLLALEALPNGGGERTRPLVPEARQALDRALAALTERSVAVRHAGFTLAYSEDGRHFASHGGHEMIVADGQSGEIVFRGPFGEGETVTLDLRGERVVRCSQDEIHVLDLTRVAHRVVDLKAAAAGLGPLLACRLGEHQQGVLLAARNGRAAFWSGLATETPRALDLPDGLTLHDGGSGTDLLLASTADGEAQLREVRTGALRASLPGRGKPIDVLEISQDGGTVLIRDKDGLRIWEVAPFSVREVPALPKAVVKLSQDGRVVLMHDRWPINSRGGGFELWDSRGGGRLAQVEDAARLVALTFSAGGRLAGLGVDGSVRVFEANGREVARVMGHQSRPLALAASPDGRFVVSSGFDTRLVLWDLEATRPFRRVEIGQGPWAPIAGGTELLVASGGRLERRAVDGTGSRLIADLGGTIGSLTVDASGERALATRPDGEVILVDLGSGGILARLTGSSAVVAPDGTTLVLLARDGAVVVHDAQDGRELVRHEVPLLGLAAAAFVGPHSDKLLVWSESEAVMLDLRTGQAGEVFRNIPLGLDGTPMQPARGRAFLPWEVVLPSPDGRRVATADAFQPRIWDPATGRMLRILQDHVMTGSAGLMRFSPDGATLFTTERGRIVTAWDVESGARLRSFTGHAAAITTLRVSGDGRYLLTGSEDRTARIWDAASGIEIAALGGHAGSVRHAEFWPGGGRIATTSTDGAIRFWLFSPEVQPDIDRAKLAIGRCLTQQQRRRHYLDPAPPAWCFTGPGLERETDPAKWQPRAPYHMPLWQSWHRRVQAGQAVPVPRTD